MENHSFKKLEYYNILEKLSTYAITYIGKSLCINTAPCFSYTEIENMQKALDETYSFVIKFGLPPLCYIPDVLSTFKKLDSNYTLSVKEILEINSILTLSDDLRKYFYLNENLEKEDFTILDSLFSDIYVNTNLSREISFLFIDENTINDRASKKLFEIRKKQKNLEEDIKNKLNSYITSSKYKKYIQESLITIRNDRYVIPVKNEYRSFIKGFTHDISSSGSTVFIEPISVFDLNNEINSLKAEEAIEIEKILMDISSRLSPISLQINNNINLIGNIDYLFAKAKYSISYAGTSPILNKEKKILLFDARNPLIAEDKVVPINIELGISFQTLVITGPNTGGKTVALKTVGLILLMAYSGLYIPAKENSYIPVLDMIFADIGDDQSIQESLSTFSSHITNIKEIIKQATENCLVLLDELGSGTDPIEGSSLAISILEYLHNMSCITIATSHYSEIKKYALVTDGFENASSEFDIENLKPTYRLILGVPGKSNAFEISSKLGLPEKIIDKAKSLVNDNDINIEELLKNIYNDKIKIDHEKEEIEKKSNQIDLLKQSLKNKSNNLQMKKEKIIENAKQEALELLLNAKNEAGLAIKKINNILENFSSEHSKDLNLIRNNLNNSIKSVMNNNSNSEEFFNEEKYELKPNMNVYITNLNQNGIILSTSNKSKKSQIQIGNNKLTIKNKYIIPNKQKNMDSSITNNNVHYSGLLSTKTAATEINLLGMTVEEANFLIDKFLDDASIQHIKSVRIVHGKGTGALKNGIHNFLKTHPHVKSYRLGTFGEGEMGVTIVEIK